MNVVLFRALTLCLLSTSAFAAEHITLRNGFTMDCIRRELVDTGRVRLFTSEQSYIEVAPEAILQAEFFEAPAPSISTGKKTTVANNTQPTAAELRQLLTTAGAAHRVDADLLAAVVRAESNNRPTAVSRAGAQGLMQLMPGTARELGVQNSFHADENVNGGSAYLDTLLTRYHDNMELALAAYNAGPGAVDRYHGIPPYRETRAYVARVIREFNRRKLEAQSKTITAQAQ